ncbi:F-box domain containing protein,putative,expressed [Hordeum vulgare]|nr:F-box domain containing protein,putative,expressed [Hordeum vulgare]
MEEPTAAGPDWSNLPPDVLTTVLGDLEFPDLFRAADVCTAWRATARALRRLGIYSRPQTPCLFYTTAAGAELFSLADKKAYRARLPDPPIRERNIIGSSYRWLVTADARSEIHLLNPATRRAGRAPLRRHHRAVGLRRRQYASGKRMMLLVINNLLQNCSGVSAYTGLVPKTEADRASDGARVIAGAEGAEDLIPTNRWMQRVNLPGRVEYMNMSMGAGRRTMVGHEEGAREPIKFYVQIRGEEDISMLTIPPKFRSVMKEWLVNGPPRVASLSANKWCDFWV